MADKVIVITGAGTGLGREMARTFGKDGDHVVLIGRRAAMIDAVAAEIGERAMAVQCDISDPASVDAAFEKIGARHGKIDVLINNAAIYYPFMIDEGSATQIKEIIDTNLTGTIFATRGAIPLLRKAGGALIISVSSESVVMDMPMLSVYEASKAALERFAIAMQQELRDDKIRSTILRVGSLHDRDLVTNMGAETMQRLFEVTAKAGIDLQSARLSELSSIVRIARAIIDLPGDTALHIVGLEGRGAATP